MFIKVLEFCLAAGKPNRLTLVPPAQHAPGDYG